VPRGSAFMSTISIKRAHTHYYSTQKHIAQKHIVRVYVLIAKLDKRKAVWIILNAKKHHAFEETRKAAKQTK